MKSLLASAAAAGFTNRLLKNLDSKADAVKRVVVVVVVELLGLLGLCAPSLFADERGLHVLFQCG